MKIYINGNSFQLARSLEPSNIEMVISQTLPASQQQQSFALALNGDFIAREDYPKTPVSDNDSIDLLFPIVGG